MANGLKKQYRPHNICCSRRPPAPRLRCRIVINRYWSNQSRLALNERVNAAELYVSPPPLATQGRGVTGVGCASAWAAG